MKIQKYEIPLELKDDKFINSVLEYFESHGTITEKQENALKDILGVEENVIKYSTKPVKVFKRYFYRSDYHGDYLCDWDYVYSENEVDLNSKIQNLIALQYNTESYTNEYEFVKTVDIPENIKNINFFMTQYEDFSFLKKKIEKNNFRKIKAKNNTIRVFNSFINETIKDNLHMLEKVTGRFYKCF